ETGRLLLSAAPLTLNIAGYIRSEMGIGESARCAAKAARAAGIPFVLHDFHGGNHARASDHSWDSYIGARPLPGVNLCHINADQMPRAYAELGRDFFAARYTIGYWAWELPEYPDEWASNFALVDEVWVPSRFVQDAVAQKSPVPVLCMPHAIHFTV